MAKLLAFGVSIALLVAGVAVCQTSKPDYTDMRAVEAWMAASRIDQGGITRQDKLWLIAGAAPEGVYLSRRLLDNDTHNRGRKFTILVNRLELFEPIVSGERSVRSITFDHQIDCLRKTTRRVVFTSYTRHNLVGQPKTEKVDEPPRPFAEVPMLKLTADEICRAIEG